MEKPTTNVLVVAVAAAMATETLTGHGKVHVEPREPQQVDSPSKAPIEVSDFAAVDVSDRWVIGMGDSADAVRLDVAQPSPEAL